MLYIEGKQIQRIVANNSKPGRGRSRFWQAGNFTVPENQLMDRHNTFEGLFRLAEDMEAVYRVIAYVWYTDRCG